MIVSDDRRRVLPTLALTPSIRAGPSSDALWHRATKATGVSPQRSDATPTAVSAADETTWTFNYSDMVKTFVARSFGVYDISAYGAQGDAAGGYGSGGLAVSSVATEHQP